MPFGRRRVRLLAFRGERATSALVGVCGVRSICLVLLAVCAGCAAFRPRPVAEVPFRDRAQTATQDDMHVTVAVPDATHARQLFGVDVYASNLQPVWIEVRNDTARPYSVMLTALDPAFYSAREVAYQSHLTLRPATNAAIDDHFASLSLDPYVRPHGTTAGFVFTNLKLGTKEVRVRLYGPGREMTFEFYVGVPGFRADHDAVDWDEIEAQAVTEIADETALRAAIEALPCCTSRSDGSGAGDPLNLVVIGDRVGDALNRAGWDETEVLSAASAWRTLKAFFGGRYRNSPMSALYVFDRAQDGGFQKARDTIHQRNHLRLWLSPFRYRGRQVWVGTITRDIGIYFTTRAWNLTTHAIAPDVDEARDVLAEDLLLTQATDRFGFATGVGRATPAAPHRNLMGATWWTDGLRLVVELADRKVPLEAVRFFDWSWADEDVDGFRELIGELNAR